MSHAVGKRTGEKTELLPPIRKTFLPEITSSKKSKSHHPMDLISSESESEFSSELEKLRVASKRTIKALLSQYKPHGQKVWVPNGI